MPPPEREQTWHEIKSVQEFIDLWEGDAVEDFYTATCGWAKTAVWKQIIAEHPRMGIYMVNNPSIPLSILEILARNEWDEVRGRIADGDRLSRRMLDRLAYDPNPAVRAAIAQNPKTPNAVLEAMLTDSDPNVQRRADRTLVKRKAWRERIPRSSRVISPPAPLIEPWEDDEDQVWTEIESAEAFVRLLQSEDAADHLAAARRWAEESVWRDLIVRFPSMKKWIALNRTVSPSILEIVSRDRDPEIRGLVAIHPNLDWGLVERFVMDPDPHVRRAVIGNPKVPRYMLRTLAQDDDPSVAEDAERALAYRPRSSPLKDLTTE